MSTWQDLMVQPKHYVNNIMHTKKVYLPLTKKKKWMLMTLFKVIENIWVFSISYLWCKSVLIIQPPKLGNTRYSAGPKQCICLAIKKNWAGGGVIIVMGEGKKISTVFSFLLSLPCAPPNLSIQFSFPHNNLIFCPFFSAPKDESE